jgi:hypothetical protein
MNNITPINLIKKAFICVSVLLTGNSAIAQYCDAYATVTTYSKIINVTLQGNSTTLDNSSSSCGGYTDYTSGLPIPELSAGGSYTLYVTRDFPCGAQYSIYGNMWIDYDQDETWDANEIQGNYIQTSNTGNYTFQFNFTVPCGITPGNTRMRIVIDEDGVPKPCGQTTAGFGEVEDYTVNLKSSTSISANFFMPDTAYVGTIVNMVNGTSGAYLNEWDLGNNGSVDYTTENAEHIFTSTGTFQVRLKVANCAGADSFVKTIVIINPTAPPVEDVGGG